MSYQELLKQVGITTVAVATATVAVYVGRDQWEKYQAKKLAPASPSSSRLALRRALWPADDLAAEKTAHGRQSRELALFRSDDGLSQLRLS